MKLMVVFGTRPEAIKLAPVIYEAKRRAALIDLVICSSGQHREMLQQALSVFDIRPDIDHAVMGNDQSLATLTARLTERLAVSIAECRPDAVIVQGDTTTAFVAALASFYERVPVAHVEAGLRTGNVASPFPEELNRIMIGRMARWHFAPTRQAQQNLLREGVPDSTVFVTGNTVVDAIRLVQKRWGDSHTKERFPAYFPGKDLVLITTHRRENYGEGFRQICHAIRFLISRHPELGFVFPVHLNPQVRRVIHQELAGFNNLQLTEPIDFETLLFLQQQSRLIITDSGGIQEEAPFFGVPTVVMREHTERNEGIEAGFSVLAGTRADAIIRAAEDFLHDGSIKARLANRTNPYGDGVASRRIIASLLGEPVEAFHG